MVTVKRFIKNHKFYIAVRDNRGKFITVKRWNKKTYKKNITAGLPKKTQKRIKFKTQVQGVKKRYKAIEKARTIKKITKAHIIDTTPFSKVTEYRLNSPLRGKRGVMVIEFRFIKFRPKHIQEERGFSNKMSFPAQFSQGYNLCLQRAMSKLTFSPDEIRIIAVEYNYYIDKNSKLGL